ncbi:MAG: hypothetical protein ACI9HK_004379 [Pirellulaceae bacterium]|jgi:hypothetical protein
MLSDVRMSSPRGKFSPTKFSPAKFSYTSTNLAFRTLETNKHKSKNRRELTVAMNRHILTATRTTILSKLGINSNVA